MITEIMITFLINLGAAFIAINLCLNNPLEKNPVLVNKGIHRNIFMVIAIISPK